tara:strand:+ start:2716 stop:2919 length:204 start_codon:yes stop_codon:yes gene_type:complete
MLFYLNGDRKFRDLSFNRKSRAELMVKSVDDNPREVYTFLITSIGSKDVRGSGKIALETDARADYEF